MLPPPRLVRKGGVHMDVLISFLLNVLADVVSHCINKWFDEEC